MTGYEQAYAIDWRGKALERWFVYAPLAFAFCLAAALRFAPPRPEDIDAVTAVSLTFGTVAWFVACYHHLQTRRTDASVFASLFGSAGVSAVVGFSVLVAEDFSREGRIMALWPVFLVLAEVFVGLRRMTVLSREAAAVSEDPRRVQDEHGNWFEIRGDGPYYEVYLVPNDDPLPQADWPSVVWGKVRELCGPENFQNAYAASPDAYRHIRCGNLDFVIRGNNPFEVYDETNRCVVPQRHWPEPVRQAMIILNALFQEMPPAAPASPPDIPPVSATARRGERRVTTVSAGQGLKYQVEIFNEGRDFAVHRLASNGQHLGLVTTEDSISLEALAVIDQARAGGETPPSRRFSEGDTAYRIYGLRNLVARCIIDGNDTGPMRECVCPRPVQSLISDLRALHAPFYEGGDIPSRPTAPAPTRRPNRRSFE